MSRDRPAQTTLKGNKTKISMEMKINIEIDGDNEKNRVSIVPTPVPIHALIVASYLFEMRPGTPACSIRSLPCVIQVWKPVSDASEGKSSQTGLSESG
jgi:hypothetical protein